MKPDTKTTTTLYREIRATYDDKTITVYQAYNATIADAAVSAQKLNASPEFKPGRMTWIKPSWAWMLYRSGYSYKDPGQARILALKMKHEHFLGLLQRGVLSSHGSKPETHKGNVDDAQRNKTTEVRIQWDPERTVRLRPLPYRSIQIGIPGTLSGVWAEEWIDSIEDVTDKARKLKSVLDERSEIQEKELVELGLMPEEEVFDVSESIRSILEMDIYNHK